MADPITPRRDDKVQSKPHNGNSLRDDKSKGIPSRGDHVKRAASESYAKNDASSNFGQDQEDELDLESAGPSNDPLQPYPPSQPEIASSDRPNR